MSSLIVFPDTLTRKEFGFAIADDRFKASLKFRLQFELKRKFHELWQKISTDREHVSKDTVQFGLSLAQGVRARMTKSSFKDDMMGADGYERFPHRCFEDPSTVSRYFFRHMKDRKVIVEIMKIVFDVREVRSDNCFEDVQCYELRPNISHSVSFSVMIDLVCPSTSEAKLVPPFCDILCLQVGPCENDTIQLLEHAHLPQHTTLDSVMGQIKSRQTFVRTMTPSRFPPSEIYKYNDYLWGVMKFAEYMMKDGLWMFKNMQKFPKLETMCDCCVENKCWEYVYSHNSNSITHRCVECGKEDDKYCLL